MSGAITWEQILFFFGLLSLVAGVWWRVEGEIEKGKSEASTVVAAASALSALNRLAEHRLIAQRPILPRPACAKAPNDHGSATGRQAAVDHMALRVDRVVENLASKPRPRAV